jgi:hypothetical protein
MKAFLFSFSMLWFECMYVYFLMHSNLSLNYEQMNGVFLRGFINVLSLDIPHKDNGLFDSHGISGETFFGPRLKIEYVGALGFCW